MLIAAYAIGATKAFVYVRAEYPLAIVRLEKALAAAKKAGLLGENILGSGFSCDIRIKAGAGAFVCGEETALIESLEGNRGMPRLKPPFPAEKGYTQAPSNINNVETFANVAWIILNGGAAFAAMGTETSKGTKVFALTGKIKRGGLVEIPMGLTLRDVIFGIGGGIRDGGTFKAVQMGGPSGGCIPEHLLDTKIDYKALGATGAIMGSGGMVVMDSHTCMVNMARFFLDFTAKESCGKCVHCRIHEAHARDPHAHHRGQGQGGRRGAPPGTLQRHQGGRALRPRADGPEPGPHHDPLLPRRVRRPHPRGALPGARVRGAQEVFDRPREVQGLHDVREEVPRGRDLRRTQEAARDRPVEVHQVRTVRGHLQVRRGGSQVKGFLKWIPN